MDKLRAWAKDVPKARKNVDTVELVKNLMERRAQEEKKYQQKALEE